MGGIKGTHFFVARGRGGKGVFSEEWGHFKRGNRMGCRDRGF